MPDRPYTDDDLRTEAARQHYILTSQLNGRQVLGRMLDARVQSTCAEDGAEGLTWDEALNCGEFDEPEAAVRDLIRGAADVSAWAIDLGADGLEPSPEEINLDNSAGAPFVRMHFAFHPDMAIEQRQRFVLGVRQAMANSL